MKDEEFNLEEIEASHTLGGYRSLKGDCDSLTGDTTRTCEQVQKDRQEIQENVKRQVWNTMLKRDIQECGPPPRMF